MIDEKKLIRVMWDRYNGNYNNASRFSEEETEMAYRVLSDLQLTIENMSKFGEWTPCSLMLPKKHEHVLTTWKCGEYYHTTEAVYEDNGWLHYCPKNLPSDIEIIAWMPLPEPYQGE